MQLHTALQISQVLRPAALILTSILLSKTGLSTAEIGNFESLFFIGTTVSYFWVNGLMQATLTYPPPLSEAEKPIIYRSIALIFSGLSLIIFLIFQFFPSPILSFLTGNPALPYFSLFTIHLLFTLPAFFLESYWTVENTPLSILTFSIVSNVGFVLAVILPLWLKQDFIISFYALIALGLIRFIWLIIVLIRNKNKTQNTSPNLRLLFTIHYSLFTKLALPLIAYSLLNGFIITFVSWLVGWWTSGNAAEFAIFRFGAREFPLTVALTTGLSNAFVPKLAQSLTLNPQPAIPNPNPKNTEGGISELKNSSLRLWHLLFPMSIVLMLIAKPLFPIVFNSGFTNSANIFCIFLLLTISRALFPQTILLALKETKVQFYFSILETISVILLGFIGIYALGTEGVAWALVAGFLIEKLGIIIYLKHFYKIELSDYTNIKWYLFYVALLLMAYFIQNFYW